MSFISRAEKIFITLRQAFIKVVIQNHFNIKHHIQMKMNVSGYTTSEIFHQQNFNDLRQ